MTFLGRIQRGDLPGQVVLVASRCELVDAHRHTHPKGDTYRLAGHADPGYSRRCIGCVAHRILKSAGRYAKQVRGTGSDRPARRRYGLGLCDGSMAMEGDGGESGRRRGGRRWLPKQYCVNNAPTGTAGSRGWRSPC